MNSKLFYMIRMAKEDRNYAKRGTVHSGVKTADHTHTAHSSGSLFILLYRFWKAKGRVSMGGRTGSSVLLEYI